MPCFRSALYWFSYLVRGDLDNDGSFTLLQVSLVCRGLPQTLGLELGLSASWLSPAWVLGAKRIWLEISTPLPSCVTLVKSLRLSKPVLLLATRWSSPHGDYCMDSMSNRHGAASVVLAPSR